MIAHDTAHTGAAHNIVYFLPIKCMSGPATKLPKNAPAGGMEPTAKISINQIERPHNAHSILVHDAMALFGKSSGFSSSIDGTAGDEYPRTSPMQKYAIDTHNESIV